MTNEELEELTNKAKNKLKEQNTDDVDIYEEFRSEIDNLDDENVIEDVKDNLQANESNLQANEVEPDVKLKYEMSEEEYQDNYESMQEAQILNEEELIYPGGPTVSELTGWKKKYEGANIYASKIIDEMFVFRTINRFEYKQLVRQANLDAAQREEVICETTVLHPYNYNWRAMAKREAGIPSTLSQIIMQKSGFTDEYYIEKL